MAPILIVDDNKEMNSALARTIKKRMNLRVDSCFNLETGLAAVQKKPYDVIFLDVVLPDGNGIEALPKFRETQSMPEIIILTGKPHAKGAEMAIKSGAWNYVRKPCNVEEMLKPLREALQYRKDKANSQASSTLILDGIVGSSFEMRKCFAKTAQAAEWDYNVLITGETGTGKELFARAIHKNSSRWNKNFVTVDCTVLPEELVETCLFGHIKGAYTNADSTADGLVRRADGGTLFLDEVGELPLAVQKKFLRVLEQRCFIPVGANKEQECDFRLIVATHRDLDKMVAEKQFRGDLLFRLRGIDIHLPPLRERKEDIEKIVDYHLDRLCKACEIPKKEVSSGFLEALHHFPWPGNVRELIRALENALSIARNAPNLFHYHLPSEIRIRTAQKMIGQEDALRTDSDPAPDDDGLPTLAEYRKIMLARIETQYLEKLLRISMGNMDKASEISGLSRSRIYQLLRDRNITRK